MSILDAIDVSRALQFVGENYAGLLNRLDVSARAQINQEATRLYLEDQTGASATAIGFPMFLAGYFAALHEIQGELRIRKEQEGLEKGPKLV